MSRVEIHTIRRAQAGDEEAFRRILETYQRPVLATLYRLLGPRFDQEVEDFAQDLFLRIFRAIDRFDFRRRTRFSTWIYTFTKNYCCDVLKKKRLEMVSISRSPASDGEEMRQVELPARDAPPGEPLEQRELRRHLVKAVDALPEEQRLVFVLREYQQLNHLEIARIVGISEGTVKSRLYRAKDTLRIRLAPYLRDGSCGSLPREVAKAPGEPAPGGATPEDEIGFEGSEALAS